MLCKREDSTSTALWVEKPEFSVQPSSNLRLPASYQQLQSGSYQPDCLLCPLLGFIFTAELVEMSV